MLVLYPIIHSVKTGSLVRRRVGAFGLRTGKLMNGYKPLRALWSKAGMTSKQLYKTCCGHTSNSLSRRLVAQRPTRQYEFPTGYNTYFGSERYQVGEQYFYHSPQLIVRISAHFIFLTVMNTLCTLVGFKPKPAQKHSGAHWRRSARM
jgi:hypothetical protein